MTKPYIFFPFSHISKDQLEILLTFLPSFYFFPVASDLKDSEHLQTYVDTGRIIPIFSEKEQVAAVEQAFNNYKTWADVHRGSQIQLKSLISDNPYFTSDTDVSAIKSQITPQSGRNTMGEHHQTANHDLLQKDFLFLKIAKEYDIERENIALEFNRVGKAGENMISGILGSDSSASEKKPEKQADIYDPGEIMTQERLGSFLRTMAALPFIREDGKNPIWVSTSEALIACLEIICTKNINTLDINPIKVHEKDCEHKAEWQKQLSELILFAAEHKMEMNNELPEKSLTKDQAKGPEEYLSAAEDDCSRFGRIRVSHFFGENINTMFNLKDKHLVVCLIRLT